MTDSESPEHAVVNSNTRLPCPRVGDADRRSFRAVRLPNGVECLVVRDRRSRTTACAATVGVGASHDPRSLSGLAHFTEHMCFLGSDRYPGENEYKRYLSAHGGRSNAATGPSRTTFHFDVRASHAATAVDMFGRFFARPSFTEDGASREVQAVDSENSKNTTNDGRRRLQIFKAAWADPRHHHSKFSTGNAETLNGGDAATREALVAFHRRHYRPENITVCAVGPQELDVLEGWLSDAFGDVEDRWGSSSSRSRESLTDAERLVDDAARDAPAHRHPDPPPPRDSAFAPPFSDRALVTLPLRPTRRLSLTFPVPPRAHPHDAPPSALASHLLGHEGPGSPFALLQDRGLCRSLSAGLSLDAPDQALFRIDADLTEKGEEEWEEVARTLFRHCALLRTSSLDDLERSWRETAALRRIRFHHAAPPSAVVAARSLAESMRSHGTGRCLDAGHMLDDPPLPVELWRETAEALTPDNCMIERCGERPWNECRRRYGDAVVDAEEADRRRAVGRRKEPWYGVDYYLAESDPRRWDGTNDASTIETRLPEENRYLPRSLDLCDDLPPEARVPDVEKRIEPPNLLVDDGDSFGRLWHRLDDRYALPKSSLTLLLRNSAVEHEPHVDDGWSFSTKAALLSSMLVDVFEDSLAQDTYDADLAGARWSLSKSSHGLTLRCGGYSDRLPDLVVRLWRELVRGDFLTRGRHHFRATKEKTVRNLKGFMKSRRADAYADYYASTLLSGRGGGVGEKIEIAEAATLEDLVEHHRRIMANTETIAECLFSGNVSETEARDLFGRVRAEWPTTPAAADPSAAKEPWVPGPLHRRLDPGRDVELHFQSLNSEEENGAVLVIFQSNVPGFRGDDDEESLRSSAAVRLLAHMLREPLFDELRTKQQLGYVVRTSHVLDVATRLPNATSPARRSTTIDSIEITVLSKKVSPPELLTRIDDFLSVFRESLVEMPLSEIEDRSDALARLLTRPITELGTEASGHLATIRRYGPTELPWDRVRALAGAIESLGSDRASLLDAWDRVVAGRRRARIASHVYGQTFPLGASSPSPPSRRSGAIVVVGSPEGLAARRGELAPYGAADERKYFRGARGTSSKSRPGVALAAAAAALVGVVGVLGVGAYASRTDVERSRDDAANESKGALGRSLSSLLRFGGR